MKIQIVSSLYTRLKLTSQHTISGFLVMIIQLDACSVTQSCPTLCDPLDCSLPGSSLHGIFRQEYQSRLPFPPPGHHPDPGIKPMSSALQVDSLPTEPSRKAFSVTTSGNLNQMISIFSVQVKMTTLTCKRDILIVLFYSVT